MFEITSRMKVDIPVRGLKLHPVHKLHCFVVEMNDLVGPCEGSAAVSAYWQQHCCCLLKRNASQHTHARMLLLIGDGRHITDKELAAHRFRKLNAR